MTDSTKNILLIAGIGVVVYLILTKKSTPAPQIPLPAPAPLQGNLLSTGTRALTNNVIPDVLNAVDQTWFQ